MEPLVERIKETIEEHGLINSGDYVILGLSGGPDSVCLFDVLLELSEIMHFELRVVHVNHRMRPESAEADQAYVEQLCETRGVICDTYVIDCKAMAKDEKLTPEEAGRKARYNAFYETAAELAESGVHKDKIRVAVAHNADDQSETTLFRIIRGTGTDGLAAMDYMRRNKAGFIVIRPLLDVSREEIEKYCGQKELEPCTDETNSVAIYTRNKIRLELIPYIEKEFNPNIKDALRRLCDVAREDKIYLDKETDRVFDEVCISLEDEVCTINKDLLIAQEKAIRHRIIKKAFAKIGLASDITNSHLNAADRLMYDSTTSAQVDFPRGYVFRISYNKAECYSEEPAVEAPKPMKLKARILYAEDYVREDNQAIFDLDKMAEVYDFAGGPLSMIIARTREPGDFIKLAVGTKSIQDLFVDMKVPRTLRDSIYMAAIGNEIIWIPEGISKARYSSRFKVTDNTARLLILEMESEL